MTLVADADALAALREVVREELRTFAEHLRKPVDDGARLVDVGQAAQRLGLSASTVYKRAEACKLPSVKDGSRLLFRLADLDAYAEQRRRSPERVRALALTGPRRRHNALHNGQDDDGPEASRGDSSTERG